MPLGMSARHYKKDLLKRLSEKHDFLREQGLETKKEARANAHKETSDLCKSWKHSKLHSVKDTGPWLVSEWVEWKEYIAWKRERRVDDIATMIQDTMHIALDEDNRTTIDRCIRKYGPKETRKAANIVFNHYHGGNAMTASLLTDKIDEVCYYRANGREWKG